MTVYEFNRKSTEQVSYLHHLSVRRSTLPEGACIDFATHPFPPFSASETSPGPAHTMGVAGCARHDLGRQRVGARNQ